MAANGELGAGGQRLGARLRAVRKQKGFSLQDVEERSNQEFKASVLGAYERGQRRIAVSRLERLAQIYRVPLSQILVETSGNGASSRDEAGTGPENHRAVIDLTKLECVAGPEREVLRRYLRFIEVQRQDFNGRVITIRGDDLRIIASLFQQSPAAMIGRLDELGLLVAAHA